MKNNKVLKAASLSMALVLVGGATITPTANVYAKEDGVETKENLIKRLNQRKSCKDI